MTPRDRRALLLGGASIMLAVGAFRAVPFAARWYRGLRIRAVEQTSTLRRARDTVRAAPAAADSFTEAARELVALAPKLVDGGTAAEAQAALSAELNGAALHAGLRVMSLNAVPDSGPGAFAPVVVRAEFEGDLAGLAGVLRHVEGGPTLLTVRSLEVLAPDPLEREAGPERLRITMVVSGWRLRKPGSAS